MDGSKNRYVMLLLSLISIIGLHSCAALAADASTFERPLSTKDACSISQGWGSTSDNRSAAGRPLSVGGTEYPAGIGTHAPGEMVFPLAPGKHHHFTTRVGVDDTGVGGGTVVFQVQLDGRLVFDSGVMKRGQALKSVDLDVSSVKELRLAVTDAGDGKQNDFADWIEPTIDEVIAAKPVPAFSTAGFYPVPGSPREVANFNPGWRFFKGDVAGAEAPGFDDAKWEAADLPHGLETLGENASGGRNYQGAGMVPKAIRDSGERDEQGNRCLLRSRDGQGKGVGQRAAGRGTLRRLPAVCSRDRQAAAHGRDAESDRCARRQFERPDLPARQAAVRSGFHVLRGDLSRCLPHLDGPCSCDADGIEQDGSGRRACLSGSTRSPARMRRWRYVPKLPMTARNRATSRCAGVLESADLTPLATMDVTATVASGAPQEIVQRLEAPNVHLWFPNDPYLHNLRTELLENGKVVDSFRTRFGIRLFEMRVKDGFFINGKFIGEKLSGVNRHQDYPYVGNALPDSGQWRDALLLREGGCNVVRAAHYPLSPAFLDACDALGLLVTTANPGWQFYDDKEPLFKERILDDTRNLVRRDRNRPSVFLWETALNETDNQPASLNREMHLIAHAEHPFPRLLHGRRFRQGCPGRDGCVLPRLFQHAQLVHPRIW